MGYLRALADCGLEIRAEYMCLGTFEYEHGAAGTEMLMNLQDPPTAVFCVSDLLAISAIHKAADMGIKVGSELSIMGFDNITMCEMMLPTVATVEQPCSALGETVVSKLISNFGKPADKKDNGQYTVPHRVILRDSVGRPVE